MACHAMLFMLCYAGHALLWHATLFHAMRLDATTCYATSCYALLRYAMLCLLCDAIQATLCFAMLAILFCSLLSYAMLCVYASLSYWIQCYYLLSSDWWSPGQIDLVAKVVNASEVATRPSKGRNDVWLGPIQHPLKATCCQPNRWAGSRQPHDLFMFLSCS